MHTKPLSAPAAAAQPREGRQGDAAPASAVHAGSGTGIATQPRAQSLALFLCSLVRSKKHAAVAASIYYTCIKADGLLLSLAFRFNFTARRKDGDPKHLHPGARGIDPCPITWAFPAATPQAGACREKKLTFLQQTQRRV